MYEPMDLMRSPQSFMATLDGELSTPCVNIATAVDASVLSTQQRSMIIVDASCGGVTLMTRRRHVAIVQLKCPAWQSHDKWVHSLQVVPSLQNAERPIKRHRLNMSPTITPTAVASSLPAPMKQHTAKTHAADGSRYSDPGSVDSRPTSMALPTRPDQEDEKLPAAERVFGIFELLQHILSYLMCMSSPRADA
ncbi:hypothetical protein M409DRAFT_59162 [Zasmidium cellare ATCC 36951]|uniref:Uncharacterized protein n=1 Tax=Zasmidium cellare ATCC 36951 TaxID=1080233 RepID=A0A6A6C5I8_ZASCE|nr:uncharacterized protein M409DRAFT_59162 [Zasmidium cellare ATCC 36951]KAF2161460.1 hypothetical protein M409DRAFT_59162 [Zasmidium cellare ATCC 36951]